MDKPPAFQFYANDFVTGTSKMTPKEVGGYILLLCEQWDKGGIPGDDVRAIGQIMRCPGAAGREIWDKVASKFERHEDGLWRNARMEEVRQEQLERRLTQAENGARGGRPRKANGNPTDNPIGKPKETHRKPKRNPNESSSVFSTDPDTSKNDVSGPIPGDLLAVHSRLFVAKYGQKPEYDGAKDAAIAKRILAKLGLQRATERVEAFFASQDKWISTSGHGFGFLGSATVHNKLIAEMAQRRPMTTDRRSDPHFKMLRDTEDLVRER